MRGGGRCGRLAREAQIEQTAQTLEQLVVAEGFAEEVVDALHRVAQFLDDTGGEAEDADVVAAFQVSDTAGGRGTVHEGHAQVHEDGAGAALLEARDGLEAVGCRLDFETDRTQQRLEEPAAVLLIIHDEDRAGRLAGGEVERLFVAGLLHDMGRLVLYRNLPRHAAYVLDAARREGMLLREAERAWLGFDHAMLAGMLLRKWRFPESLEKAVRHHHGGLAHMSMPMPATVHVADAVAGALGLGSSGEVYAPPLSPTAWGVVGLAPERLADAVGASTAHIEEITRAFLPDEA